MVNSTLRTLHSETKNQKINAHQILFKVQVKWWEKIANFLIFGLNRVYIKCLNQNNIVLIAFSFVTGATKVVFASELDKLEPMLRAVHDVT